jgi:hypothetical protein
MIGWITGTELPQVLVKTAFVDGRLISNVCTFVGGIILSLEDGSSGQVDTS